MSTRTKVVVVAALVAALLGIAFLAAPPGVRGGTPPAAPAAEPVAAAAPPPTPEPVPAPEPPVAAEPDGPAAARVGLAFRDSNGRPYLPDEVARLYADAGVPFEVRVVPESLFTGNDVADMLRMRVEPPDAWAAAVPLVAGPGGVCLAESPEPGSYRLFLGRPGAAPMVSKPFRISGGDGVSVGVHLPAESGLVRVRLREQETGAPLAGAVVTPLFEYGDDHMFLPGPPLRADSQGLVLIPKLPPEDQGHHRQPSWWAETETHLGLIPHWNISGSEPGAEMELEIARKAAVRGRAWLSNGEPAAGKQVVWMGKGLSTVATVGEDGSFRLDPVAVWDERGAEIFLVEDLATLAVKQVRVAIAPGETSEVTIGEPAGSRAYATVAGRVTIGERPVPEAFVVTRTEGEGGNKGFVKAAPDGTYRKADVQPGRVRLEVWFADPRTVDDFSARRIEPVEMAAGEVHTFDFDLPAGAFRVTVVDDATGAPVPGAIATGRPSDPLAGQDRFPGFRYAPGWGLRTGADGSCVLLAMLPGEEHVLRATADGYARAESAGHLPGTVNRPAEVTIRLRRK